jgi:hypothetical protein
MGFTVFSFCTLIIVHFFVKMIIQTVNHVRPISYTHEGGTITNGAECHKYVSKNNESLLKYHSLQNIQPATQTESVHQVSVVFVKCRSCK